MLAERVFRLDCDVAIVTGAAAGIGRATALTFAQRGAAVVVTDLKAEGAETVAREITDNGGRAIDLKCDVTMEAHLAAVIDQTVRAFGKITSLVNNAGGGGPEAFRHAHE